MNPYIGDRQLEPDEEPDVLWPDYDPPDDPMFDPGEPNDYPEE